MQHVCRNTPAIRINGCGSKPCKLCSFADNTSPMPDLEPGFWRTKPLDEMNRDEWEALCDGCAKCCLHRLEDEETREIGSRMAAAAQSNG